MKKILLIFSAIFLFFVGCKKDDVIEASKLEIKNEIVERGWDFLKLLGMYSYPQDLVSIKLYLSESSNMSGAKSYNCVLEGRCFAFEAADLKDGKKYYYCLEYDNGYEKIKNKVDFVSTVAKPVLTTENAANITITSAVLSGSVTNTDAANEIKTKGFCWSTSQNPDIDSNVTANGSGVGSYTSNLSNLSPNTTYYYRTYLTTNYGTIYGEQKSFSTTGIINGHEYVDLDLPSGLKWATCNVGATTPE